MTTWTLLTTAWSLQPSVLAGCGGLFAVYSVACMGLARPTRGEAASLGRAAAFLAGVLLLLLALISPLDTLGDRYLFSVHMAQHLLLVLIVPPLLLLGLPPWLAARLLSWAPAGAAERVLGQPALAWALGVGTLWLWHAPALYNAALAAENVHVAQHLTFLVAATVFWWPVLAPPGSRRLAALPAMLYLFTAGAANSVLGILLTFAPPGLYPLYLNPPDPLGLLPLLRGGWGWSPTADQQAGGLLMWVAGGPIYLAAILATLVRWFAEPDDERRTLHAA